MCTYRYILRICKCTELKEVNYCVKATMLGNGEFKCCQDVIYKPVISRYSCRSRLNCVKRENKDLVTKNEDLTLENKELLKEVKQLRLLLEDMKFQKKARQEVRFLDDDVWNIRCDISGCDVRPPHWH